MAACGGGGDDDGDDVPAIVYDGGSFAVPGCGFDVTTRVGAEAPAPGEAVLGDAPTPRQIRLGFGGNPANTIAVVWRTDVDTTASTIKFGMGDALDQTAEGVTYRYAEGIEGVGEVIRLHEAHLCGLTPNTEYSYQVGGEGAFSQTYTFRTAPDVTATPDAEVTVAYVGDSRGGFDVWSTIADKIVTHAPDIVVYTGDVVTLGINQAEWDQFLDGAVELLATTPMVAAHGNHETNSIEYYTAFAMPGDEENYSYDYGHVHQTILNTDPKDTGDLTASTRDFLEADLTASTAIWNIVSFHRAIWSSAAKHGSDPTLKDAFGPTIDDHAVDLVVSGHDHIYERSKPLRGDTIGTTAADGTIYLVSGGAGAIKYAVQDPLPAHSEFAESSYNFTILQVGPLMLSSSTYRDDDSLLDQFAISK
jgi:3',5'-cyclic AMP phosphodiesterase CpdA